MDCRVPFFALRRVYEVAEIGLTGLGQLQEGSAAGGHGRRAVASAEKADAGMARW